MATTWQPSRNARLTLKQLGLSVGQIDTVAATYGGQSGEKSDMAFMRYAREHVDSLDMARGTAKVLEIPLNWQPPSAVEAKLAAAGYQCDAIAHYRELFVISAREQGRALRDPGKAFLAYCRCRAPALHAPLRPDWLPSAKTLDKLVQTGQLERIDIPEYIAGFIRSHSQKFSTNWDRCFQVWVQRRRAPAR